MVLHAVAGVLQSPASVRRATRAKRRDGPSHAEYQHGRRCAQALRGERDIGEEPDRDRGSHAHESESMSAPRQRSPMNDDHPVQFSADYPDRPLNRLTTAFRIFTVIPIAIVLGVIGGYSGSYGGNAEAETLAIGGTGLLFFPPLLMIVFREKYPRWWFDWNLE